MVGIKDIAKIAGVSPSTVSNVLNGHKNVGEDTRKRVFALCEQYGYRPNMLGKNLKKGKTDTIVFNFSDFDRSFYLKIINGISDFLQNHGYDLIICTSRSSRNFMNAGYTSGAICLDSNMGDDYLEKAATGDYPIVVMDRIISNPYIKSVIVDNYPVMCRFMQLIIDKGYRKFAFLGGLERTLDNQERFAAFLDILKKNNLYFDPKNYYYGDYREKSGYQCAKMIILSGSLPEVLVCANDNMAIGAIRAFSEHGLHIPADVAVSGFDNCELAEISRLSTVEIPRYESGYLAAKELLSLIRKDGDPGVFKIGASILMRDSV
jgi:LacI family transcriptional regulator